MRAEQDVSCPPSHGGVCANEQAVIERMQDRKKRRAQLGDRKSAAAQNRMKNIASLAAEEKVTKKRKTKGGRSA